MADILIVEDEAAIRQVLSMHVKLVGHRVYEAQDAQAARTLFAEKMPDLALLDIMLPGEDGFSLGEYLIARNVPILFLTLLIVPLDISFLLSSDLVDTTAPW